jgi:hypothetical protein
MFPNSLYFVKIVVTCSASSQIYFWQDYVTDDVVYFDQEVYNKQIYPEIDQPLIITAKTKVP